MAKTRWRTKASVLCLILAAATTPGTRAARRGSTGYPYAKNVAFVTTVKGGSSPLRSLHSPGISRRGLPSGVHRIASLGVAYDHYVMDKPEPPSVALDGLVRLRLLLNAEPFRPFSIKMRDGTDLAVLRPDQLAIGSGQPTKIILAGHNDDVSRLPVGDIVDLRTSQVVHLPDGWEAAERVESLDELCQQVHALGEVGWFYRGESRYFPTRISSLGRMLAEQAPQPILAECSEIGWFQHRSHSWLTQAERDLVRGSPLGWLTLMQHHSAPTRLLDWTYSAWVAAYHAASLDLGHSGFIWAFNPRSLVRGSPKEWNQVESELDSIKSLDEYRDLLTRLQSETVLAFHELQSTARMVAQQGTFTFGIPPKVDHTEVIGRCVEPGQALMLVIPNELKRTLLERLRSMNLTAASLFPGLDGVGRTTQETMRGISTPWSF